MISFHKEEVSNIHAILERGAYRFVYDGPAPRLQDDLLEAVQWIEAVMKERDRRG